MTDHIAELVRPSDPKQGQRFIEIDTGLLHKFRGRDWVPLCGQCEHLVVDHFDDNGACGYCDCTGTGPESEA